MSLTTKVYDHKGITTGSKKLPAEVFAVTANPHLMAMAIKVYLSNQRQSTKATKTRGQVKFTGKKIWRQKGTGRARHGSKRAPIFVGGGRAHGPTGKENYKLKLPKKMRRRALLSSLSYKQEQNQIKIIKDTSKLTGKTKEMDQLLQKIYQKKSPKTLLILDKPEKNAIQSSKNLEFLTTTQATRINPFEILNHHQLLIEDKAINTLIKHYTDQSKTVPAKPKRPAIKKN